MRAFTIYVSDEIRRACPQFRGAALHAEVRNSAYDEGLWREIDAFSEVYRQRYTLDSIKQMSAIMATRRAYKACGKDPSRYRPAAEALCRRILRGIPLYQIDTLVDLVNLVSIRSGYSIGGFDADRVQGRVLTLGIGRAGEPYEGIGRGVLNIEGLPVYRDAEGGIGTPTSDHERTKMSVETTHLLAIVNAYDGDEAALREAVAYMQDLLRRFASSDGGEATYF